MRRLWVLLFLLLASCGTNYFDCIPPYSVEVVDTQSRLVIVTKDVKGGDLCGGPDWLIQSGELMQYDLDADTLTVRLIRKYPARVER